MEPGSREFKHVDLTRRIIKVFYEVYNELGFGYLESVCENGLTLALLEDGLAVQAQTELTVWFRGRPIGRFKADLIVDGAVLVELKCARARVASYEAQVLNYLRATELEIALLLNFGPKPAVRRFVFENKRKRSLNLRSSA
jgi:GxxExxY protein